MYVWENQAKWKNRGRSRSADQGGERLDVGRWNERVRAKRCDAVDWKRIWKLFQNGGSFEIVEDLFSQGSHGRPVNLGRGWNIFRVLCKWKRTFSLYQCQHYFKTLAYSLSHPLPLSQRFFLIFLRMRELRSGEHVSRDGEKEKPLVTLDLNLTFMQTPAGHDLTLDLGLVDIFKNT